MRRHAAALAGATLLLIGVPWLLLRGEQSSSPSLSGQAPPLRPSPVAAIDQILARMPFEPRDATATGEESPSGEAEAGGTDADALPQIVGIVGRLPDQAIVLIRRSAGGTRPIGVGESFGRWRLVSIGADAALFADGARRVRVELPPADAQ